MSPSGRSLIFWLAWHGTAAAAIAVLPPRIRLGSIWQLSVDTQIVGGGLALAYLASAAAVAFRGRTGGIGVGPLSAFLSLAAGVLLLLLLRRPVYPRSIIVLSLALAVVLVVMAPLLRHRVLGRLALGLVALTVVLALVPGQRLISGWRPVVPATDTETKIVGTTLHSLVVKYYRGYFGTQEITGGGIAQLGDGYLVAMGNGDLHTFAVDPAAETLRPRKLPHQVPLNREDFARDTGSDAKVNTRWFRTADILVHRDGEAFRLFASHHHWNSEKRCVTLRVSALDGQVQPFLAAGIPQAWRTVYETSPCLALKPTGHPFAGHQAGGKLAQLDSGRLVFIVGDHEFDGVRSEERLPQDAKASYGKTMVIDLRTGVASTYSMGHRNPQGLHVDAKGNVWATEHGPKDGDELNLILKGRNYGWPIVTYGRDYERASWPLNPKPGRHEGFEPPVQAWMPAIGVSDLVRLRRNRFNFWQDDLLVSSLKAKSIWRVRLEQGKAVYAERIQLDERIRDMIEDDGGRLVLWVERAFTAPTRAGIVIVEPVEATTIPIADPTMRGEVLFAQCTGCHGVDDVLGRGPRGEAGFGPDLEGIVGRQIAARPEYTYSDALKGISGKWTEARLDAFLTDPQKFAPGTLMQSVGIADAAKRADLIAYLRTLK